MAIKSYFDNKLDQTLWKATVCVRSRVNSSIRIQKAKFALKSEKHALREEANLVRLCEREVQERENRGISWGELVERWSKHLSYQDHSGLSKETLNDYLAAIHKHTQHWWDRPSESITKPDVIEVIHQLEAWGKSKGFQARLKHIIARVFRFGIDYGHIVRLERSPTYGIQVNRRIRKKPEILTEEQVKRLLRVARESKSRWYPIWSFALLTGMRSGELFALTWNDIDWGSKEVSVTKSYSARHKRTKSTKSGDWRTVPISSELEKILLELKAGRPDSTFVLPRIRDWVRGMQATALRKFCVSYGLPSIRFHTLRACFATHLIRHGVAAGKVMKMCGWKDLDTMEHYVRLAGIETRGATEKLRILPPMDIVSEAESLFFSDGHKGSEISSDV